MRSWRGVSIALILIAIAGLCWPSPAHHEVAAAPTWPTAIVVPSPRTGVATASAQAVRISLPPEPTTTTTTIPAPIAGRCTQYEALLAAQPVAWSVVHMSQLMWRESRCQPTAWNRRGQASGLLQVTPINYRYLRSQLGEWVDRWTLQDPEQNIRAAAVLFAWGGYRPWKL